MAVETPLEAPAECHDVEAAHFSRGMRGINDDGAIRSRLATLGNFLIGVIASCSGRVDRPNPYPIRRTPRRALVLKKVQPVDCPGSKEYRVCRQFDGVLLRNVER